MTSELYPLRLYCDILCARRQKSRVSYNEFLYLVMSSTSVVIWNGPSLIAEAFVKISGSKGQT